MEIKKIFVCIILSSALSINACGPYRPYVKWVSGPGFRLENLSKLSIVIKADEKYQQRLLEDIFISALLGKGYQIVARSDLEHVIEELRLQNSDFVDANACQLGKILNVPAILVVSLAQYEKHQPEKETIVEATMSARLIGVEKSNVLSLGSYSHQASENHSGDLLEYLAHQLADSFPPRTSQ